MYHACIHCFRPLGANEAIEALPVGQRLAFDAARGRLWVVCRRCERWNLTPFEERWEAIEQSERAFRDTRVRVSTDNIGLARLPDGTELVRIGAPQRPEFAAWRYGDQFGRRRRRAMLIGAGVVASSGALIGGAIAFGGLVLCVPAFQVFNATVLMRHVQVSRTVLPLPDGGRFMPFNMPRLLSLSSGEWGIDVGYTAQRAGDDPRPLPAWYQPSWSGEGKSEQGRLRLYGAHAIPVLRWAMPHANRGGAGRRIVADGVKMLEEAGGPTEYMTWASQQVRHWATRSSYGDTGALDSLPMPARLAIEMAIHEESERQAMEGELAELERAWADAEQVASIADSLLVPSGVAERVASLKRTIRKR